MPVLNTVSYSRREGERERGRERGGEEVNNRGSEHRMACEMLGMYRVILRMVKAGCHPGAIAQVVEH